MKHGDAPKVETFYPQRNSAWPPSPNTPELQTSLKAEHTPSQRDNPERGKEHTGASVKCILPDTP
eukprot:1681169-Amphidinium_carterae.1